MAVRNFCIKFGHRTKLITVSSEPEELLRDLKGKIEAKFSVSSDEYSMKLKLDEFQTYVDIDETDSDDIKLLEKGGSISLQTNITNPTESSSLTPKRSPTVNGTPSLPGDEPVLNLECSSSSDKDARAPTATKSSSLKVINNHLIMQVLYTNVFFFIRKESMIRTSTTLNRLHSIDDR